VHALSPQLAEYIRDTGTFDTSVRAAARAIGTTPATAAGSTHRRSASRPR